MPVFRPDEPKDLERLVEQREELRRAVFDPSYVKRREKYVSFWNELAQTAHSSSLLRKSSLPTVAHVTLRHELPRFIAEAVRDARLVQLEKHV